MLRVSQRALPPHHVLLDAGAEAEALQRARFRKCTSIRVGKECKYSHAPQEEPTKEPQEEEMQQANDIEAEIEASAIELQAATDKINEKKQK